MLEIDLKPGWKTYWRDPGDAGVPPTLDASASSNIASAELSFPAPQRFDDGFAIWAGYKEPVGFPVAFALTDARQPATIEAKVFLGICETICIPVQATFAVDPASDPDNADDAAVVKAALDALPGPEQPDFGVTLLKGGKDEVLVEAAFAGEPGAVDFFLAGDGGYQFGPPERRDRGRAPDVFRADPRAAGAKPCHGRAALHAGHGRRRGVGNAALPAGRNSCRSSSVPCWTNTAAAVNRDAGTDRLIKTEAYHDHFHRRQTARRHVQDDDARRRQGHDHQGDLRGQERRAVRRAGRVHPDLQQQPSARLYREPSTPSSAKASIRSRSSPSTTIT